MDTVENLTEPTAITQYYDRVYREIGLRGLRSDPGDPFVRYLGYRFDSPVHVLDLAAGFGRNALPLMDEGHRITAIDLADAGFEVFLEEVESRYRETGYTLSLRAGDVMELDWGTGYDAAMALFLIHHLTPEQHGRFFDKIEAALKPGGYLIFTGYLDPVHNEKDPHLSYFATKEAVLGLLAGRTWEVQDFEVHGIGFGCDPPVVHCLAEFTPLA